MLAHRQELSILVLILSFIHSFILCNYMKFHFMCNECMHTHTHTALYYKYIHCYYSSMVNCTTGECWCHVTEGWIAWQWVVFALSFIIRVWGRGGSWLRLGTNSKAFVKHILHKCMCGSRYELTNAVTCTYEWSFTIDDKFIHVFYFCRNVWRD